MNETLPDNYDSVQGFHLTKSGIHGRMARLGPALDAIVKRHKYPEPVAALIGEALVLTVVLAYTLKYDGIFTLQTKADGPVAMLVVDLAKGGHLRAYAQVDEERLKHAGVRSALLLGKGYLAFTVDQGAHTDRYQGIVELIGRNMAACVQNYFRQSEQLDTAFRVHVRQNEQGMWQAGALMVQRLPEGGGYAANSNIAVGEPDSEARAEDWRRTVALMETTRDEEFLDAQLDAPRLINRLFHEEGLDMSESHGLRDQCRCSRPRVAMVLSSLKEGELRDVEVNGKLQVTCEFCSTIYEFDRDQLQQLVAGPGVRE